MQRRSRTGGTPAARVLGRPSRPWALERRRWLATFGALIVALATASAAAAKTFVIVHGAFQDANAWTEVDRRLEASGHQAIVVNLPGRDAVGDLSGVSLAAYRDAVLAVVRAQPQPVVLVGHSFGGLTISSVAEAAPERIERLVYVAAYLPVSGESLQSLSARDKNNAFTTENFVVAKDGAYAEVLRRDRALLFGAETSPRVQRRLREGLLREPLAPMAQPVALTARRFGTVRKAYIKTLRDKAVSPYLQDWMISRAVVDRVLTLDSGHAPSLSQPKTLARLLIQAAR